MVEYFLGTYLFQHLLYVHLGRHNDKVVVNVLLLLLVSPFNFGLVLKAGCQLLHSLGLSFSRPESELLFLQPPLPGKSQVQLLASCLYE